jgi:hypothetical protein
MNLNDIIDKHIDKVTGKIKKNSRTNPVTTKEEFNNILKGFKMYNQGKSGVSTGSESVGRSPLLWVSIHGTEYHLTSDTKIEGINQYYLNKDNDWKVINNLNGIPNRVTNREDSVDIPGFYLYKMI